MAAHNASVEPVRNDSESTNLCVYLSNEKFAAATELLFLSLDFRTRYNIAQNYSVGV